MRSSAFADLEALRGILDAVPHPIFIKDEGHVFVAANQAMCDLMRRRFEDLIGKRDDDFVPLEEAEVFWANDRRVIETGESNENEELLSDPNGGVRSVITRKNRLQLPDGTRYVIGVITDITEFRRAEALIRHNAEHDHLTGLANRSRFRVALQDAIAEAMRSDEDHIAVLLVDLDGFKNVNDMLGHAAGDDLLVQTGRILTELAGPEAIVARLGGDEFAVIERAAGQPQAAASLAAAVIEKLSKPMLLLGRRQAHISASIGISYINAGAEDRETLMRRADLALYAAKHEGRNTWRQFEVEMEVAHLVTRVMEDDLRSAVEKRQFSLVFQPFVGVRHLDLRGYEALVRWTHPIRGIIEPALFIPIAERTGAIAALGEWVLREACAAAAQWPRSLRVSINVSPAQFAQADLPELVRSVIRDSGIDARRVDLEITETAVIKDLASARRVFGALRALGVHIVLDDFGAGYSSLQTLKSLPFDKIKIDKSLLSDVGRSAQADAIVGAILQLSRTLNLPVAAEGVETAEQLAVLRAEGCEEFQGFLNGQPAAAAEHAPLSAQPEKLRA